MRMQVRDGGQIFRPSDGGYIVSAMSQALCDYFNHARMGQMQPWGQSAQLVGNQTSANQVMARFKAMHAGQHVWQSQHRFAVENAP